VSLFAELQRRNVIRVAITYVVAAWVLTQVMEIATDAFAAPDWVLKIFIVMLVLGFVPAVIFSWVYELTPEGIKRESEVQRDESITGQTAKRLNVAVIVLLVAVVALYAIDRFSSHEADRPASTQVAAVEDVAQIDSIAVLPFDDFSAGRDQVHLAEGLADTLLHMLAQVPGLKVAARTSSFSFRGSNADIGEIGRELGVGAVLEGSVQRSGDTLRIIAQLIRVWDESHLWSETFDRPTGDIFAVQDEIANAVVAALRPGQEASAETALTSDRTSVEAYEHFVRGDRLWQIRSAEAIEESITEFKAAIAADPDYAPAHAGLAMAYIFSTYYGNRTFKEVKLVAEAEIERALALDTELGFAHAARGQFLNNEQDDKGAEAAYRRALEFDPSDATVYAWLSSAVFSDLSRWDEARALIKKAYELDPRNLFVLGQYAGDLANFGDYEGALAVYRRGVALEPDAPRAYANLANLHEQYGRHDDAIRAYLAQIERSPDSWVPYQGVATRFLSLDDQESAEEWFAKAKALNPNAQYWPYWFMPEQDRARLVSEMQANLARNPNDSGQRANLCQAYMLAGEHARVMKLCRPPLEPVLGPQGAPLDLTTINDAYFVSWSARQLGDDTTADKLVEQMIGMIEQAGAGGLVNWGYEAFAASIYAMRGDRENMLLRLRKAVAAGSTDNRDLEYGPWFAPYRDDPEFQAILEEMRVRQQTMRNSLRVEGL
jgi:TolB-like protein/tetratricopeptide (TPR) repeat protein